MILWQTREARVIFYINFEGMLERLCVERAHMFCHPGPIKQPCHLLPGASQEGNKASRRASIFMRASCKSLGL